MESKPKGNRTGFTTGACCAAAAKAAARVLIHQVTLTEIETTLPNQKRVTFALSRCERNDLKAICSIIKDAGDDPDCTHGAELIVEVELRRESGIELRGGAVVVGVHLGCRMVLHVAQLNQLPAVVRIGASGAIAVAIHGPLAVLVNTQAML